jgi:hypothetical protein
MCAKIRGQKWDGMGMDSEGEGGGGGGGSRGVGLRCCLLFGVGPIGLG